jgi:formate hydrogenlyase subunit 3/multisubunit Na+/H+ antiporter MnhD subunit
MFMAAGLIAQTLGHDRTGELGGIARALPLTVLAFAISGISLMGVPPSGGFVAKWLMLTASVEEGQWWWAVTVVLGGLIAGAYVIRVVTHMLTPAPEPLTPAVVISRWQEAVPLSLAVCAMLLGFLPLRPLELLQIGLPHLLGGASP